MREKILNLLFEGEVLSTEQIAEILNLDRSLLDKELQKLMDDKLLLGWRPVMHPLTQREHMVRAVIEVRITPERDGGFDRIAERVSRFNEVETCYLMSGAYDLMVIVHGKNLHDVAMFVSARLASIDGIISTATHFMLKAYKEQGYALARDVQNLDKPSISP